MKQVMIVGKIDLTHLLNARVEEVNKRDSLQTKLRQTNVDILTPYIAQCLYGMAEIHNELEKQGKKTFLNSAFIEDIDKFVNDFINNESNWKFENDISSVNYTDVTYRFFDLTIWLNSNNSCMIYTKNPIYQIYGAYDVRDFLNNLIKNKKYFK
jgi:hypothetical protein